MTGILALNICGIDEHTYKLLYEISSAGRRLRADRYLRQEDRIRCICAGLLLRYALGKRDFEIETGPYGKPAVKNEPGFHYNLSHSGHWVVLAYGDRPVGVDVERIQWDDRKEKLVRRCFTAGELDYVFGGGQQKTAERFFEIWTAKEAYLKYLGTGLQKPLDSFNVFSLEFPNRFSSCPEVNYSLSLWTEDGSYAQKTITVDDLLNM